MTERMMEAAREYLESNLDEALELASEMNGYDGSFEWTDSWNWDELCALAAMDGADAVDDLVRAAVYGETYAQKVRYNAYGNLEPAEHDDLLRDACDYLQDIICGLTYYIDDDVSCAHIGISNEFREVLEACIEDEEEEEEE